MTKIKVTLYFFLSILLLLSCSSDPLKKGDEEYQKGNYAKALKYFNEAFKKKPDDPIIKEKVIMAELQYGKMLYQRRKVLSTLESRYQKALDLLPANPSPESKKLLSEILYILGTGYKNMKPQNEIQKREYVNKVFDYLSEAIYYDSTNTKAIKELDSYKKENFEQMLTKGKKYFSDARKKKDDYYYLSAEYYFKKAVEFNPESKEAVNLLKKVRKITLKMLDPDFDFPIAVASTMKKDQFFAVNIYLLNNTDKNFEIKANLFSLYDFAGNEYVGSVSDLFEPQLKEGLLPAHKEISGVIVFEIGKKNFSDIEKIVFKGDGLHPSVKYFPN